MERGQAVRSSIESRIMITASAQRHLRTANGKRRIAQLIYREVYSGAPTPFLLMTPEFEIIDANDAYLAATMRQRAIV